MVSNFQQLATTLFIFCLVLFMYLHIQFHLKTSSDLEIYEIEEASKEKMEEICDLRQPVLFDTDEDGHKIINGTNKNYLLDNYPVFEIKIRDNKDVQSDTELFIPLQFHSAVKLFENDTTATYFSENNGDFLSETGAIKVFSYNDEFLRPNLVSNCNYDIMMGSTNVETPLRYDINYRNYYLVTQGSLTIKLAPPKSSKYMHTIYDYENFEFKSPIDVWNPQNKFKADFDKIKFLEITLVPGKFLFIPAYWWYSFKFDQNTSVSCFKYRTYMNTIAISPYFVLYALQNQNVERKFNKTIDVSLLNNNTNNSNNSNNNPIDEKNKTIIQQNDINDVSNAFTSIPDILIPKEEPELLNNFDEIIHNTINNTNNNLGIGTTLISDI